MPLRRTQHWNNSLCSLFSNFCGGCHHLLYAFSPHNWFFIDNKYLFFLFFVIFLKPYQSLIWLLMYNLYVCLVFMLCYDCILKTLAWWSWYWISMFQMDLNLISTFRSAKKSPKNELFCSFVIVLSISTHLYCSYNGEVFIWTFYALTWIPGRRQTWCHVIQRKELNSCVPKTWSDWNLCSLGVQDLIHPEVLCTRRNNKLIRKSEKYYLVFIYSICLHP